MWYCQRMPKPRLEIIQSALMQSLQNVSDNRCLSFFPICQLQGYTAGDFALGCFVTQSFISHLKLCCAKMPESTSPRLSQVFTFHVCLATHLVAACYQKRKCTLQATKQFSGIIEVAASMTPIKAATLMTPSSYCIQTNAPRDPAPNNLYDKNSVTACRSMEGLTFALASSKGRTICSVNPKYSRRDWFLCS